MQIQQTHRALVRPSRLAALLIFRVEKCQMPGKLGSIVRYNLGVLSVLIFSFRHNLLYTKIAGA